MLRKIIQDLERKAKEWLYVLCLPYWNTLADPPNNSHGERFFELLFTIDESLESVELHDNVWIFSMNELNYLCFQSSQFYSLQDIN